ncbi:MAG: nitroreductase [Gammaproteobacteria bacterium]|nr:nitroreductase [Gammaproteobacteria bacterium]MBT8111768.1 nitroreductase [Gammaproteobacteria bacterium]NND47166.1 nitroreductase [Woeseiaceae bacterium]NNL46467.1 nitroreductase [Woeseiaceae bacterium]
MKQRPPSYETQELREFAEVLRGRRTINLFLQTPVPDELVRDALEAATWAPNHHVTEPWRFILPGEHTVQNILDLCRLITAEKKNDELALHKRESWAEKPGWLIVTCKRSGDELRQQEDYAACCAAVQNFMLYLWKAGVGSKWTTGDITRDPRFFDIIDVDRSQAFVVGLVWFGYPKLTPGQSRKELSEVLRRLP